MSIGCKLVVFYSAGKRTVRGSATIEEDERR